MKTTKKKQNLSPALSLTMLSFSIAVESQAATLTFDQVGIFSGSITQSGIYEVRVRGANGGGITGAPGGIGALIGGSYYLTVGTQFTVLIGGSGGLGNYYSGGGGGLSYFDIAGGNIDAVAGGGGGSGGGYGRGLNGLITMAGGGIPIYGGGGTNGSGGQSGLGGGGAGIFGNGGIGFAGGAEGGQSAPSFSGGLGLTPGGFGGGGSGESVPASGGGGGGFSGGAGGYYSGGGGGGSYLSSIFTNRVLVEGNLTDYLGLNGNGFVSVHLVPVPGSLFLFASALTAFAASLKRVNKSNKQLV